ncbi:hypothetical protein [Candidatus Coxiella mudrowiae]|uniref:hypothetical protein n=1 Tax=Candidatus Coxiella mudrowiae TaxID=2054173 RepID=UPI001561CA6B|nr:hypothetical protein [Candidatus Coxiella mudrowiae]
MSFGFMSNRIDTVVAMLATTSIGAIWSAYSPDFGLEGLVDRFEQIEQKVLFAVESHSYKGKTFHHLKNSPIKKFSTFTNPDYYCLNHRRKISPQLTKKC